MFLKTIYGAWELGTQLCGVNCFITYIFPRNFIFITCFTLVLPAHIFEKGAEKFNFKFERKNMKRNAPIKIN